MKKFEKSNTAVVGMSADSVKALASFKAKRKLNFPLLSDPDHKTIQAFGSWRQKKFMGRSFLGIVRSSYLIGPDGKIEAIWDQASAKGHAAEVLAKVTVSRVMKSETHA
jgi:peroxiredoxin Q/BCP